MKEIGRDSMLSAIGKACLLLALVILLTIAVCVFNVMSGGGDQAFLFGVYAVVFGVPALFVLGLVGSVILVSKEPYPEQVTELPASSLPAQDTRAVRLVLGIVLATVAVVFLHLRIWINPNAFWRDYLVLVLVSLAAATFLGMGLSTPRPLKGVRGKQAKTTP